MSTAQAILYLAAVILIGGAALGVTAGRISLALLGAACALLAYSLPAIAAL